MRPRRTATRTRTYDAENHVLANSKGGTHGNCPGPRFSRTGAFRVCPRGRQQPTTRERTNKLKYLLPMRVPNRGLLLASLVACLSLIACTPHHRSMEDAGDIFTRQALESILRTWDIRALDRVAAPDLYKATSRNAVAAIFKQNSKTLGSLKSLSLKLDGEEARVSTDGTSELWRRYLVDARFVKDRRTFKVRIRKRNGAWLIVDAVPTDQ